LGNPLIFLLLQIELFGIYMKSAALGILSVLFVAVTPLTTNAQLGIEFGLNMPNLALKAPGSTIQTTFRQATIFGMLADINYSEHIYFEPGFFFEGTGCKVTKPYTDQYDFNTIVIPLNFEYKSGVKCASRFFCGFGPYVAYNMGGLTNYVDLGAPGTRGSIDGEYLKQVDVGLGFNLGYQIGKRWYGKLAYTMGFTNLSSNIDGNSIKASAISVTVGHLYFTGCSKVSRHRFSEHQPNHWRGLRKGKWSYRIRKPYRVM
jgi:hypothetical protein